MSFLATLCLVPALLASPAADRTWKARILKERAEKDASFRTGKASPMAGVQRFTVPKGEVVHFRLTPKGLETLTVEATGVDLTVRQREGRWMAGTAQGEAVLSQRGVFSLGRFHIQVQLSPENAVLLVFDPERPELKAFTGLHYFEPDAAFAVKARLERLPKAEATTLPTTRNERKPFTPYARVHFRLEGKPQVLLAYRAPGDDSLFIPFTDLTTGEESYTVGRFMDVKVPTGRTFLLDFNGAYNPLCAYSGVWNCPIPPDENQLKVAIRAGEKAYGSH